MISAPPLRPAGKGPSLPPEVVVSPEQVRHRREDFAPKEALRLRVQQTPRTDIQYKTLNTVVCPHFLATLKMPRPTTQKTLRARAIH
jgi:hypothetical protein